MIQGKKILITGANGVLGYAISRQFQENNTVVLSGIESKSPTSDRCKLPYQILDISNKMQVNQIILDTDADILINCAAYTSVDGCESEKEVSYRINTLGTSYLANACKTNTILFVHYSSDYLFDGESGPYGEEAKVNPINEYGKQKLEAETLIEKSGVDSIILRTNVLFGEAADQRASFVSFVVNSLKAGKDINIVDDQYNNPTWSDDLAEATDILIHEQARGTFNYGGSEYMSRLDFAYLIASVYNLPSEHIHPISTASLNLPAARPLMGGLKNTKIRNYPHIPNKKLKTVLNTMKGQIQ